MRARYNIYSMVNKEHGSLIKSSSRARKKTLLVYYQIYSALFKSCDNINNKLDCLRQSQEIDLRTYFHIVKIIELFHYLP